MVIDFPVPGVHSEPAASQTTAALFAGLFASFSATMHHRRQGKISSDMIIVSMRQGADDTHVFFTKFVRCP